MSRKSGDFRYTNRNRADSGTSADADESREQSNFESRKPEGEPWLN